MPSIHVAVKRWVKRWENRTDSLDVIFLTLCMTVVVTRVSRVSLVSVNRRVFLLSVFDKKEDSLTGVIIIILKFYSTL